MTQELVQGNIGSVGKYDVKFEGGKLIVEADAAVPYGSLGAVVKVDAGAVIDAIAAAIPGKIDDAILGVLKAALLGI